MVVVHWPLAYLCLPMNILNLLSATSSQQRVLEGTHSSKLLVCLKCIEWQRRRRKEGRGAGGGGGGGGSRAEPGRVGVCVGGEGGAHGCCSLPAAGTRPHPQAGASAAEHRGHTCHMYDAAFNTPTPPARVQRGVLAWAVPEGRCRHHPLHAHCFTLSNVV